MEPTKEASGASGAGAGEIKPMFSEAQMRKLRFAVVAMGAILLMGFALVIGRIVYLLNRPPVTADATAQPQAATGVATSDLKLALPAGAVVRNLSLSGNRLAVQYDSPAGGGIAIVDLTTGRSTHRIDLVPGSR